MIIARLETWRCCL